jgi:hypothetical protein
MKKLDNIITKNNLVYKLYKRTDTVAMYSVHLKSYSKDEDVEMPVTGYEVFKIKKHTKPLITHWGVVDPGEMFPGNHAFGFTAWSYASRDKAIQRFNELNNNIVKADSLNPNKRMFLLNSGYTVIAYKKGCVVIMKDKKIQSNQKQHCIQACVEYAKLNESEATLMSIKQMVGVLFAIK